MSSIRGTPDYTTQLPPTPSVGGAAPTGTVTGPTTTTPGATDAVDAPPSRGTFSAALGQPRVTGGTSYDANLGATTLQDVGTVSDILASTTSSSDMATLLAKLLIAFNSTDKDSSQQLIEAAMDRQKAEQQNEANKVVQLAELMDAAQGGCMARQRTEDKLLEMGYSPAQAHAIATQMTDKHTTPGQQAILALAAVEAAPGNQKAGAGGDAGNPAGLEDPTAAQRKAAAQQADSEAAMLLLMLLLASRSHAVEGGLAATGQRPGQPVITSAPPAA